MNIATQKDIGSLLKGKFALIPNVVTAGGGGDGVEQDGAWVERSKYLSGKLIIAYSTTLAEGETLTLAANLQDDTAGDGAAAADYGDAFAAAVVATGDTGGSTETGVVEIDVSLQAADAYVRCQVTPTLSAGSTDTAAITAVFAMGGTQEVPAT